MAIVGTNTITTYDVQAQAQLPDVNQGFPCPVITSTTPVGAHGAVPAFVAGPSYDVFPIRLSNGQYTLSGAKPPALNKL